ncbi:MAG: divergent polysaccharide deacetylase family protein, partial [Pseudomonadota bacterium]
VNSGETREPRIALAVEGAPETLAQPDALNDADRAAAARASDARPILRGAAGATLTSAPKIIRLTSTSTDAAGPADTDDVFADISTQVSPSADAVPGIPSLADNDADLSTGEVVITIDGAPARQPGARSATKTLSNIRSAPIGAAVAKPIKALLRKTVHGNIPQLAGNGRRASRAYAKPFDATTNQPKVSIVVAGLGLNPSLTEQAIQELPAGVTLAFAPYAKNLDRWTARARAAGHELVLELPMEAHHGAPEALGPAALLTRRSAAENIERLKWLLARFEGYFAVTNYLGGKFSADAKAFRPVLDELKRAGVAYIDDTGAVGQINASADWAPVTRLVAAGGDGESAASVRRDLAALETAARRDGSALGKAYLQEQTLTALIEWTREAEARGVAIAPASAVLQDQGGVY